MNRLLLPSPRRVEDDAPGLAQIADKLTDILVTLARVEERSASAAELAEDHERRLRALERWRWSLPGAAGASAVAALASLLAAVLHR